MIHNFAAYMQTGNKLAMQFPPLCGQPNPNNKTIHIRAIVDEAYVVYRYWVGGRRQRWEYEIKYIYFFQLLFDNNELMYKGKSRADSSSHA